MAMRLHLAALALVSMLIICLLLVTSPAYATNRPNYEDVPGSGSPLFIA
jgi:hypothetical protein